MRKTYVQIQTPEGPKLVEKDLLSSGAYDRAPAVHGDVQAYKSMITGEMIEGRTAHREHLKRHGVVEVGNDLNNAKPRSSQPVGNLKEMIARQVYQRLRY